MMAGPRMSWPLARLDSQGDPHQSQYYLDEKKEVNVDVASISSSGGDDSQIIGSSNMFDENGNVRLIPVSVLDAICCCGPRC